MSTLSATFQESHAPRKPLAPKAQRIASCRSVPTASVAVWWIRGPKFLAFGQFLDRQLLMESRTRWAGLPSEWNPEFPQDFTQWIQAKSSSAWGCKEWRWKMSPSSAGRQTCHQPAFSLPKKTRARQTALVVLSWSVGENRTTYIESPL